MTEQQKINWKRSGDIPVLQDVSKGAVHMLQFPLLEQQSWISHGFSTRMGGVSEGCYASMNLSFTKGDDPEKVRENYRRMADMLGMDMERMTLSFQTYYQCASGNRRRCWKRNCERTGLYRCRWSDHQYSGDYPGDLLCRLCAAVLRGSGPPCHRSQPFRLAGNRREDRKENRRADERSLRKRSCS